MEDVDCQNKQRFFNVAGLSKLFRVAGVAKRVEGCHTKRLTQIAASITTSI